MKEQEIIFNIADKHLHKYKKSDMDDALLLSCIADAIQEYNDRYKTISFNDFYKWLEKNKPNDFIGLTRSQFEFCEVLIGVIETNPDLKKTMIAIGNMVMPFELLHQYYHEEIRNTNDIEIKN